MAEINIHFRNFVNAPINWIDALVDGANQVFQQVGHHILVTSNQSMVNRDFEVISIGGCGSGALEQEQVMLFNIRDATQDIVFYVVRATDPPAAACAAHPADKPGAILVYNSDSDATTGGNDKWLLAHELGHILSLNHRLDSRRLMWSSLTWTQRPPQLLAGEGIEMAARLVAIG